jgi:hypothetical protein
MKKGILILIIFTVAILRSEKLAAAGHYVSPAGTANWSASTSINTPCALSTANANAAAGDVIYMLGGTYSTSIEPSNNGTSLNRIVFRAFENEEPVISGTIRGASFTGKSYITIKGLTMTAVDMYVYISESHHINLIDCSFHGSNNTPPKWWTGIEIINSSHHNIIRGCTIVQVGFCTSAPDDIGGVMRIGRTLDPANDHSDYNLLENNILAYGGHHVLQIVGKYNVIRNNYFHNEGWMACDRPGGLCGNRSIIIEGDSIQAQRNLLENNRFAFSGLPSDDNAGTAVNVRTPCNIIRNNVFYHNDASGVSVDHMSSDKNSSVRFNKIVHNTFYHNAYTLYKDAEWWRKGGLTLRRTGGAFSDVVIKNNIFYDNNTGAITFYNVDRNLQVIENNWEEEGDPKFFDITTPVVPEDPSYPDLNLNPESPCIDKGAYLTSVTSPAGSGTSFQVADAGYFTDGWGIEGVVGDKIRLSGTTAGVQIIDVDYFSNTITVNKPISWTQNQGISYIYEGALPDIGAYEYAGESERSRSSDNLKKLKHKPKPFKNDKSFARNLK